MGLAPFSILGHYELDVDAAVSGQNIAENYSDIYWRAIARITDPNRSGNWSGNNAGNNIAADSPRPGNPDLWDQSGLAYDFRRDRTITLAAGTFRLYHDANGYLEYWVNATVNLVNIGRASTGSGTKSAPRIPKAPAAPPAPRFSQLAPTTARVSWDATPNDNGAGIDQYLLRIHTVSPATSPGYKDYPLGRDARSYDLTGLRPATDYYAVVYARNSRGYSPVSGEATARTLSGAWVWNGSSWRSVEVLTFRDGRWRGAELLQAGGDGPLGGFGLQPFGDGPFGGFDADPIWIS